MNTRFKFLLGGFVTAVAFLLLLSFKQTYAQAPSTSTLNQSIPIPKEIAIFDTTISLSRYDMRERFDREMLQFVYQHSLTITTLKRANNFFPVIEPILAKNGVPDDFKYLALIESSFNVRSVSPAKAAGIWQLMPATAKELGLEINEDVDERYHIEKSTEAACRYFNKAYERFGDWFIVAASYNAGMARLNSRTNRQQSASAFDLLLPEETSRYLFRMLAAKELLKDPRKYGFILQKEDMFHTIRFTEVTVDSTVADWADFAKQNQITYFQLKDFNMWLRNGNLVNKAKKTYKIKIPCKEDLNFNIDKVVIYQKNWVQE